MPAITNAQPGFGDDVDDLPIDVGVPLLVAAGVGYDIKQMKKRKQQ